MMVQYTKWMNIQLKHLELNPNIFSKIELFYYSVLGLDEFAEKYVRVAAHCASTVWNREM